MIIKDIRKTKKYKDFKKFLYDTKEDCMLTDSQFDLCALKILSMSSSGVYNITYIEAVALCDAILETTNREDIKRIINEILDDIKEQISK